MKNNKYTVLFTICVCATASIILTFANIVFKERILLNQSFARMKAVLRSYSMIDKKVSREDIIKMYNDNIVLKKMKTLDVYNHKDDIGYGIDIKGAGKYGQIKGVLTLSSNRDKILGLSIYEQHETPGLGARIASKKWLAQFKNLPFILDDVFTGVVIDSKVEGPNVVDSITGASKTTFVVSKMINKAISKFLAGGREVEELNLGLTSDAVTKATPGYPKNIVKPPHLRDEIRRPPFMVTPGLKNLAFGKPVSSSMLYGPVTGELDQIVDNVKKSDDFDFIEFGSGPQWVQIDLEKIERIYAIVVWHFYKNSIIYNDVIVQISDEPEFKDAVTVFNNDHDNSSGLGSGKNSAYFARWWGEIVDLRGEEYNGVETRFIRVFTAGGAGGEETRFIEVAVYGK